MLQRPHNWDSIEPAEFGSSTRIPPGPYTCRIANAYATNSKNGKPMLVLEVDCDSGEYSHFFSNKGKLASFYQLTEGNSQRFFKGLITAIEASNEGYIFDFDPKSLIGKRCCVVFREEEFISENRGIAVSSKIYYITSLQKMAEGIETPPLKKLEGGASNPQNSNSYQAPSNPIPSNPIPSNNITSNSVPGANGYIEIDDDDLPF